MGQNNNIYIHIYDAIQTVLVRTATQGQGAQTAQKNKRSVSVQIYFLIKCDVSQEVRVDGWVNKTSNINIVSAACFQFPSGSRNWLVLTMTVMTKVP